MIESPIVGVHIAGPSDQVENDMNHATTMNEKNYDMINQIIRNEKPEWMEEFIIGEENEEK